MEEMQVYDAHDDDTDYSNPPWATIIATLAIVVIAAVTFVSLLWAVAT